MALITSNPRLVDVFLSGLGEHSGFVVPLAVWISPSMRFRDRIRDLYKVLARRVRINRSNPVAQFFHHLAYRHISAASCGSDAALGRAKAVLHHNRCVVHAHSVNAPDVIATLADSDCALGVVVGADVFTRRTLKALSLPLVNVHLSDPAYSRGMPPVFWEVWGGQDSICITIHELIARLDAGAILFQKQVPIVWRRSLTATIRDTRTAAALHLAPLLHEAVPAILRGEVQPRHTAPSPLRTDPTLGDIIRAARICRRRSRD